MTNLIQMLQQKGRTQSCNVTKYAIQYFDDGDVTPCPNSWMAKIANVLDSDQKFEFKNMANLKIYRILNQRRNLMDFCKNCYSALDLINLYIDGSITEEQLQSIPLLSGEMTQKKMKSIKHQVQMAEGKWL